MGFLPNATYAVLLHMFAREIQSRIQTVVISECCGSGNCRVEEAEELALIFALIGVTNDDIKHVGDFAFVHRAR